MVNVYQVLIHLEKLVNVVYILTRMPQYVYQISYFLKQNNYQIGQNHKQQHQYLK